MKQIEGFFKTTLRLPLYGNYSPVLQTVCFRYTIQSTPLKQVRVLVPMCLGVDYRVNVIEVSEFNQTGFFWFFYLKEFLVGKEPLLWGDNCVLIATIFPFYYDVF